MCGRLKFRPKLPYEPQGGALRCKQLAAPSGRRALQRGENVTSAISMDRTPCAIGGFRNVAGREPNVRYRAGLARKGTGRKPPMPAVRPDPGQWLLSTQSR